MSELRYCCVIPGDAADSISREDGRGICPLKTVSVSGLIRDAVAEYTLVQTYVNPLVDAAVEAVYTFPLYEGVAVCGFDAEVNGRRVVGRVQEKVAARKEYESAKKAGKVASLLEEETPDTFQASVGNIPPSTTVTIHITLVSEIKQDGSDENQVRFVMPTTIAPRYGYNPTVSTSSNMIDTSSTVLSVDMRCVMSKPITSIRSPSHTIEVHLGSANSTASVSLTADSLLDCDFVIIVQALGLDEPRALVERHPRDGTHAISLTFAPRFALNPIRSLELVFIVDRSGSMDGTPVRKAGAALELFLRSIPCEDHYFNVIGFGSHHQTLFPKSVSYNAESLKKGTQYAQTMQADMGGTEMMSAFEAAVKQRRRDMPLQIFLLTDGEIWDVDSLCTVIRDAVAEGELSPSNSSSVRVFSLGIGDCVSHHLIESVARAGGGYAQLVMESERMEKKVLNMLKSALVPPATDLQVQWAPSEAISGSAAEEEYVMLVEEDSAPADPPLVEPPSDPTNKAPINLFSTSPEVPSPPPPPPALPPPRVVVPIHQAPFKIPILSRGARFTVYAILSSGVPTLNELVLQGLSPDGPVELKVKVETVQEGETMLHSLAARALVRDLEEGTSCVHALGLNPTPTQKEMVKRLGVHVVDSQGKKLDANAVQLSSKHVTEITNQQILDIALRYNLSSKYTSWVAVDEDTGRTIIHDKFEDRPQLFGGRAYHKPKSLVCCAMPAAPIVMASACYTSKQTTLEPAIADMASDIVVGSCESGDEDDIGFDLHQDDGSAVEECSVTFASYAHPGPSTFHPQGAYQTLEGDEATQELITSTDDPHSRLRSILQLQSFDGSFPLVPEIAPFFSTTMEDLNVKLAEVRKQCTSSTTLSEAEWGTIWATCLAVEFMTKQLPELQDEWELVVEKAEKKVLELLLKNVQDVAAMKEAATGVVAAASAGSGDSQYTEVTVIETKSEVDYVETVVSPELKPPLPCLIGIAELAPAVGSAEQKSST